MNEFENKARSFWAWFEASSNRIRKVRSASERLYKEIESRLHEVCPQIGFEIGGSPDSDDMSLVITAFGDVNLFDTAYSLVAHAPPIKSWNILALKPPLAEQAEIEYEGIRLSTKDIYFSVIDSAADCPIKLEIVISARKRKLSEGLQDAALLLIASVVGERAAAMNIEVVELRVMESKTPVRGYRPILELPSEIRNRFAEK